MSIAGLTGTYVIGGQSNALDNYVLQSYKGNKYSLKKLP